MSLMASSLTIHKLKPKQSIFIFAPESDVVFVGGIGTLKTSSLIKRGMVLSEESPNNLGVIVRKTFTDLHDSTMRDFELETGIEISKHTKEAKLSNGSVIMFRHGDELATLKNLNLGWFAIEQAEEFGSSLPWDMLQMRLRRKVKRRSGFMIANANGHNWIYNRFIREKPANARVIEATTEEFRDIHPPDYFERLSRLPDKLYKRYVLNSHDEAQGLVYDEFSENKHVVQPFELSEHWEKGFVLDHGFTNPTAVLWYCIDYDGNIILYDEHYEREHPPSYHSEKILKRGLNSGLCDPSVFAKTQSRGMSSELFSIADEYRDFGVHLSPAIRASDASSIARVNEFFKSGRIKVFSTLPNFIEEINNWKYRTLTSRTLQNLPEEPEDKDNHLMDDLKYLIASRFPVSQKPEPKDEKKSLGYYEKVSQMQLAKMEEDNERHS